jgi:hypothetical protein
MVVLLCNRQVLLGAPIGIDTCVNQRGGSVSSREKRWTFGLIGECIEYFTAGQHPHQLAYVMQSAVP